MLFRSSTTPGATSRFLGAFADGAKSNGQDAWKTYALDGNGGSVSFDLYRFDSWDGENFNVYINDQLALSRAFTTTPLSQAISGTTNGYSWTITANGEARELSGNYGSSDQSLAVSISVPTGVTSLKLGFGSSLDQASSDESYGVDALSVVNAPAIYSTTSSTPKPTTALSLDGSGGYADLPDVSLGGDLSVEAWVFMGETSNWSRIVDIGTGATDNNIVLGSYGNTEIGRAHV